jgi:hypothetical protein
MPYYPDILQYPQRNGFLCPFLFEKKEQQEEEGFE